MKINMLKKLYFFVFICLIILGCHSCLIGEGCSSKPATVDEWVRSLEPTKIAFRYMCTANITPSLDPKKAIDNLLQTIDLLVQDIFTTLDGVVIRYDDDTFRNRVAQDMAENDFKAGIRRKYAFDNEVTIIITDVKCEKIYELKPPVHAGQCKADNDFSGDSSEVPSVLLPPPPPDKPSFDKEDN